MRIFYGFALALLFGALTMPLLHAADADATAPACMLATQQARVMYSSRDGKKHAAADALLDEVIRRDAACDEAAFLRVRRSVRTGDFKTAEKLLSRLWRKHADRPDIAIALATVYLRQNKRSWALRTLNAMTTDGLSGALKAQRNWLLALVSWGMDDCPAALQYIAEIGDDYRPMFAELPLVQSRCELKGGDPQAALTSIETARLEQNIAPAVKPALDGVWYRAFAATLKDPWLRLGLRMSGGWDSNPIAEPDQIDLVSGTPGSGYLSFLATASTLLKFSARAQPGARLAAGYTYYFDEDAEAFSRLTLDAQPFVRLRFRSDFANRDVIFKYRGTLTTMNGGPLVEEDDFYVYSESHGGEASILFDEPDFGQTRFAFGVSRRLYHHNARNATEGEGSVTQSLFFMDNRLRLYAGLQVLFSSAYREYYDRWGAGLSFSASALLPWRMQLVSGVRLSYRDYYNSDTSPTWEDLRKDWLVNVNASLLRPVIGDLLAGVEGTFLVSASTVEAFSFIRWQVAAVVSWSYSL